jgi:ribonuclease D
VVGNDVLIRLAAEQPTREGALKRVPGCTPTVVARLGEELLLAVARGLAISEDALPVLRRPRKPRLTPAVAGRIDSLMAWRAAAAARFGLDAGLLLPRRLIERLAEAAPSDSASLAAIDGIRRWRVAVLGQEILATLGASVPSAKGGERSRAGYPARREADE